MSLVIYTKPDCPYCQKARDYYNENGIEFTEYDAQNDTGAQKGNARLFGRRSRRAVYRRKRRIRSIGLGQPAARLNDHSRLTGSLPVHYFKNKIFRR